MLPIARKQSPTRKVLIVLIVTIFYATLLFILGNHAINSVQPNGDSVVYVTRTGEKYHSEKCRHLSQSKYKTTIEDARKNGYTACSVCDPPRYISESQYHQEIENNSKIKVLLCSIIGAAYWTTILCWIGYGFFHVFIDARTMKWIGFFIYVVTAIFFSIVGVNV